MVAATRRLRPSNKRPPRRVQIATVVVVAVDVSTFYSYYTDCTASFAFADEYLLLLFRVLVYWNVVVAVIEIVAAVAELVVVVAAAASDLAVMMMTRTRLTCPF